LFLGIQQKKRDLYRVTEPDTSLGLKKKVFDKVMQLERLIEEEAILIDVMKQHWTHLTRTCRALKDQASILSDGHTELPFRTFWSSLPWPAQCCPPKT
ncbi:hypothetical protein QQF64_001141, partial [Cirrhinus molitorella]